MVSLSSPKRLASVETAMSDDSDSQRLKVKFYLKESRHDSLFIFMADSPINAHAHGNYEIITMNYEKWKFIP